MEFPLSELKRFFSHQTYDFLGNHMHQMALFNTNVCKNLNCAFEIENCKEINPIVGGQVRLKPVCLAAETS